MDDDVNGRGDLPLYGRQGNVHPHEHHGLQSPQHVPGAVGVAGAEATLMSGGHSLYHVNSLCSSDLPHDDAVRPHPEGSPDKLPDGDLPSSLHVWVSGLQPHQVGYSLDLKLRVVLDGNDPLLRRYELGQGVEKRGLAGTGASADEDIVPGYDQHLQEARRLLAEGSQADQVLHGDLLCGKFPDRHHRPVEGHRIEDHIDSGSI